jgi:chromosome segregation ATPase
MQEMLVDFDECLLSKVDEIKVLSAKLEKLQLQKEEFKLTAEGLQRRVVVSNQAQRSAEAVINILGDEIMQAFGEVASMKARLSEKMAKLLDNSETVCKGLVSIDCGVQVVQQSLDEYQTKLQAELGEKAILQDRVLYLEKELLAMHEAEADINAKVEAANKYATETVHKALLLSRDVEKHTLAQQKLKARQTELEDFIKRLEIDHEEQVAELKGRCTELEIKMQEQSSFFASQIMVADSEQVACKEDAERRCRVLEAKVEETGKRWAEQCVNQVSELEAHRDLLIKEYSELESALKSKQKELLENQQESKAAIIGLQEQIQTMEGSHATQVDAYEQNAQALARDHAAQIEQMSSDHAGQVASWKDRCSDLEGRLHDTTLKGVALAEQIVGLEAQCQHLESSAREGRQRESIWLQQLDETRNKMIDLEKVMSQAARAREEVNLELRRKKEEALFLQKQHADALAQLATEQKHEREQSEAHKQRMQSSLDECRLQRRLLTAEIDRLKERVRGLQSESESLAQQLRTAESTFDSESEKMKQARAEFDTALTGLEKKHSLLEASAGENEIRVAQLVAQLEERGKEYDARLEEREKEYMRSRLNERELENRVGLLEMTIDRQKAQACRQLELFKCQELYIKNAIGAPVDLDLPLTVPPEEQEKTPASPSKMAEYAKVKFAADAQTIDMLTAEAALGKERVKGLEEGLAEAEGQISSLRETNASLQDQLSALRVLEEQTSLGRALNKATEELEAMRRGKDVCAQELVQAQEQLLQAQERSNLIQEQLNAQLEKNKELAAAKMQSTEAIRLELDNVLKEQDALRLECGRVSNELNQTLMEMDVLQVESQKEKDTLHEQHIKSLEALHLEFEDFQAKSRKDIKELQTRHGQEIDALQVESQREKDAVHEQHLKSLEAVHLEFYSFKVKSRKDMDAQLDALQVETRKAKDAIRQQHLKSLEEVHLEFEAFKVQSRKDIEELQTRHGQEIDALQVKSQREKDAVNEQHLKSFEAVQLEFKDFQAKSRKDIEELQARHGHEIDALQVESRKAKDATREQHLKSLEAVHLEFEAFKVQSRKDIEELQALHVQGIEPLEAQLALVKAQSVEQVSACMCSHPRLLLALVNAQLVARVSACSDVIRAVDGRAEQLPVG